MSTNNLTKPQRNILSVVISETRKTKGKNRGQLKGVVSSDCYDGRSFGALVDKGLVESYDGVLGCGFVATDKAMSDQNLAV